MLYYDNNMAMYCSFFGYFFPFLFYFLFWNRIYNFKQDLTKINLSTFILINIYAFLVGISTEFVFIISFFQLLIILITNYKSNIIKKYIIVMISLCAGILCFIINPNFQMRASSKFALCYNSIDISKFLSELRQVFWDEYIIYLVIIAILFCVCLYLIKNIEERKSFFIIVISILISILLFNFVLIFGGFPEGDENIQVYHILHSEIINPIKFLFIVIILNELVQINQYKQTLFYILLILSLNFIYLAQYSYSDSFFKQLKNTINQNLQLKRDNYIVQKTHLYYYYNNKVPPLIWNIDFEMCSRVYFPAVYNINPNLVDNSKSVSSVNEIYNRYLKDGGKPITDAELQKLDFNLLKNKNLY